jgi:hypothetical protein
MDRGEVTEYRRRFALIRWLAAHTSLFPGAF